MLPPHFPTNVGLLGLSVVSHGFTPFLFKLNAIKTLVFQSYSICSNYHDMHKEFNFLKDFFVSNGFPANLTLSVIKHFLDRRINTTTTTTTTTTVPDEATEHIKYISLPFFGPQSEKLKNEIFSLFKKYCSHFTIEGQIGKVIYLTIQRFQEYVIYWTKDH